MSRQATLSIKCNFGSDSISEAIKMLIKIGWTFRNNKMEYLPIHDNDMYDWQCDELSYEKLFSVISQKQANHEQVGVILYYKNTERGITVLADSADEIIIAPDVNRKTLCDKYTDVSWYITSVVAELEKAGCYVEQFMFSEF